MEGLEASGGITGRVRQITLLGPSSDVLPQSLLTLPKSKKYMFSSSVQSAVISLFSSTSSHPLALFSVHSDPSLPSDSFIALLNDTSSKPTPAPPAVLMSEETGGGDMALKSIGHTVLHIQSPTLKTTYIRTPPCHWSKGKGRAGDLGIKLPWIYFQIKDLEREHSLEIGIVDHSGREGRIRCSTFQVSKIR